MIDPWVARFLRWGGAFLLLGLAAGYLPLGHYLLYGDEEQCSWAPVHGHVILLGWLGMTAFALTYRALYGAGAAAPLPERLVRRHFALCAAGVVGVLAHGVVGWFVLAHLGGHHVAGATAERLWHGVDGLFLTVYGAGCVCFWLAIRPALRGAAAR
jgi:hypothetical protein